MQKQNRKVDSKFPSALDHHYKGGNFEQLWSVRHMDICMQSIIILPFFQSGAICLHAASMKGHAAVVKALLLKGAPVDSRTKVCHHFFFSFIYICIISVLIDELHQRFG